MTKKSICMLVLIQLPQTEGTPSEVSCWKSEEALEPFIMDIETKKSSRSLKSLGKNCVSLFESFLAFVLVMIVIAIPDLNLSYEQPLFVSTLHYYDWLDQSRSRLAKSTCCFSDVVSTH